MLFVCIVVLIPVAVWCSGMCLPDFCLCLIVELVSFVLLVACGINCYLALCLLCLLRAVVVVLFGFGCLF